MKHIKKVMPFHTDHRGAISYLSEPGMRISDVLIIDSKKEAIRANHYHKHDSHIIYLVKGKFNYITRDMSDPKAKSVTTVVNEGESVITPPMLAHKVEFLEDSVMIVITTEKRDQKQYEADTVRLEVQK
jgi:quercetin dioxygenase-like cupin family protein